MDATSYEFRCPEVVLTSFLLFVDEANVADRRETGFV